MRTIVSILVCNSVAAVPDETDGCEILYTDEERGFSEILKNGIKQAKGKYSVIVDGGFEFADADGLINELSSANADMVLFGGATAFKTSVLKSASFDGDKSVTEIFAALNAKNLVKSEILPFTVAKTAEEYSESVETALLEAINEFTKTKAKLAKEVYTYCFDKICLKLADFYVLAMLAVKNNKITAEKLVGFDEKIKKNVVLYLAFEKRFAYADLKKLRKNNFKISFFTAKKFQKIINL